MYDGLDYFTEDLDIQQSIASKGCVVVWIWKRYLLGVFLTPPHEDMAWLHGRGEDGRVLGRLLFPLGVLHG